MHRVTRIFAKGLSAGPTLTVLILAVTLPIASTPCGAQQVPTILFSAHAYGTTAFVGNVVTLGQTAPVSVGSGCGTAKVGAKNTGTLGSVNDTPLVSTGLVNTSAASATGMATGSADVYSVSMLAGLITAQEVKSVSTSSVDNIGNLRSSAAGSTFVNLVVNGQVINGLPAPNTTINLTGFGKVVLNEQIPSQTSGSIKLTVNMIHLYITVANALNIQVGTQAIVSDAASGIVEIGGPAAVDGFTYGTSVSGHLINSSPTAPVGIGCRGTGGKLITNSVASVNVPNILTGGTVYDTGQANVTPTAVNSQTTDNIQAVNLLAGLVTASVIEAQADASTTDGVNFNFSSSATFTNLFVTGHPEITDSVPPNTTVPMPNLGTLYLHRVLPTTNDITVIMIELRVTQTNVYNLPIGADIRIGYAEASLHSLTHP